MTDDSKTAGRELGYGNVDARVDESPPTENMPETHRGGSGGESGGGARPADVETTSGAGSPGGQSDPVYRGGDNPNAVRDERDA